MSFYLENDLKGRISNFINVTEKWRNDNEDVKGDDCDGDDEDDDGHQFSVLVPRYRIT